MPINHLVKEHHSFDPDEIKVLATAFDAALLELGLGRTDPAARSRNGLWPLRREASATQPDCARVLLRASDNPALPSALQQQKRDRRALSRPLKFSALPRSPAASACRPWASLAGRMGR